MQNTNTNIKNANIVNTLTSVLASKKGQMGMTLTTETECRMKKTNNPLFGRVKKVTAYSNARFGVSYENAVNGKLKRDGLSANFVADKSATDYLNDFINTKGDQAYLKVGLNSKTKRDTIYLVDGKPATADDMGVIRQFEQKSAPSAKQQSYGIQADDVYYQLTIKVENVVSISQGDTTLYHRDNANLAQAK